MSEFDVETAVEPVREGVWATHLSAGWNIGGNSNGGYALTSVLRAMRSLVIHPDPISVTTHFLRPAQGDTDAAVRASVVRAGRTVSTLRGSLWQEGKQRLEVVAAFSDLSAGSGGGPEITEVPPTIPPVEECVHRAASNKVWSCRSCRGWMCTCIPTTRPREAATGL